MLLQIEYYTNVLTLRHISNSTCVPSPDIGVERVRPKTLIGVVVEVVVVRGRT